MWKISGVRRIILKQGENILNIAKFKMNKILTSLKDKRIMVENQTNKLKEDIGYFYETLEEEG
ncbi:hypothetical protein RIR_e50100_A0A2N0QUZ1_9GLOM [Rhizophagus irregularis DAOM 181602=DAOM 197198]|nr:hypothetical protein RIR_e50100_A0A2N0QUZ1_9GLOM [Rhizophagus irregularis DAOM 181602=DAOM 197198]